MNIIEEFNLHFHLPSDISFRRSELEQELIKSMKNYEYHWHPSYEEIPEHYSLTVADNWEQDGFTTVDYNAFPITLDEALACLILRYTKYQVDSSSVIFNQVVKTVYET